MPSRAFAELLAVVVPPACVACRDALPRAELWLCASCTRALPWLPARTCARCGLAAHRRGCPAAGAAFARAWAPLAHDGVARQLVAALKFRGALPVAALMAAHVAANLPESCAPASPPRSCRSRRRPCGRAGGGSIPPAPCGRARATARASRPALPAPARPRGAPGRLEPPPAAPRGRLAIELRAPPPRRALLVDDVHTTGATLDACARALVAGGCGEVVALTYTRTL